MSLTPQAPKKSEDLAFALLTFPFATIERVGARILAVLTKKENRHTVDTPTNLSGAAIPAVTPNLKYVVADRVHSAEVRGHKIGFYQYHEAKIIRISCRELRYFKPIDFTPAVAEAGSVAYDIDGAIQWVRQNGLESEAVKHATRKPPVQVSKGAVEAQLLSTNANAPAAVPKTSPPAAAAPALNIVPAGGNKSAPFTGKIVSFGITKRSGGTDKKPYMTYAMKLQSESGAYEKEFIGEHLSDLVTDLELKEGQLVRIQLIGKHHFEVEVAGKMEPRSRNHFEIQTL